MDTERLKTDTRTQQGISYIPKRIGRKYFIGCLISSLLLLLVYYIIYASETIHPHILKAAVELVNCSQTDDRRFEKIIHFIDSIRPQNKTLVLTPRQACAIESAARNNPDWKVVLYTFDNTDLNRNNVLISALESYINIEIKSINLKNESKDTFVEGWVNKEALSKSKFPIVHYSDFYRLLVLWKYGGLYLDTDFLILKSLSTLEPNFSVAETDYWVASAAMAFDIGYGRHITSRFLSDFMDTYDPEKYSINGPGLITKVAQRLCATTKTIEMTREKCYNFEVLPSKTFYPIGYDAYGPLFEPQQLNATMEKVKDAFALHCWNGLIGSKKLLVGTKAAIGVLADKNCPTVYWNCGDSF